MQTEELKLKCLEMAVAQVIKEGSANFRESVADLQSWFYNRITDPPVTITGPSPEEPEGKPRGRKPKADKSIFS